MKSKRESVRQKLGAAGLALTMSMLVLTGCTAMSHVSARLHGTAVEFVDCDDSSFNTVLVLAGPHAQSISDAPIVWKVQSHRRELKARTAVTLGSVPVGFTTLVPFSEFDIRKSRIEVTFADSTHGTGQTGQFQGSSLVEGKWVNWSGNTVDHPCS